MTTTYDEPQPGGRIAAAESAGLQEHGEPEHVEATAQGAAIEPVPTRQTAADESVPRTLLLQIGATRQLLPQDPGRKSAVLIALDNSVVICANKELAQDANNQASPLTYPTGAVLPVGVPVTITSKALHWAANPSTTSTSRISVFTERYANPTA
jgi:hypothetical protein